MRNLGWILLIIFFIFMLYLISNQSNNTNVKNISNSQSGNISQLAATPKKISGEANVSVDSDIAVELPDMAMKTDDMDISNLMKNTDEADEEGALEVEEEGIRTLKNVEVDTNTEEGFVEGMRRFFSLSTQNKDTETVKETVTNTTEGEKSQSVNEELIAVVEKELSGEIESPVSVMTFDDQIQSNNIENDAGLKSQISDEAIIGKGENYDIFSSLKEALNLGDEDGEEVSKEEKEVQKGQELLAKEITQEITQEIAKEEQELLEQETIEENTAKEMAIIKETSGVNISEEKVISPEVLKEETAVSKDVEQKSIETGETDSKNITTGLQKYTVGVSALKLNNAWFTKKLGTVYKGDTLKQLTPTNKYGCFQVEVVRSTKEYNNGKIAWVCKYYMEGYADTLYQYEGAASNYYGNYNKKSVSINQKSEINNSKKSTPIKTTGVVKQTKIGTLHTVVVESLKLNNKNFNKAKAYLLKGDTIEQLSTINKYGCFEGVVYGSNNAKIDNKGKIGWVCQNFLR